MSSPAMLDVKPTPPPAAAAPRVAGRVCMVAYTNYAFDARVRREAETLAEHGYDVVCLTTRNEGTRQFMLNGVRVRELGVPKYRGKSQLAYLVSYLRFLAAASLALAWLTLQGQVDVVHVHNLPDFLVFAGVVPRLFGRRVVLDVHDSVPETYATKFSGQSLMYKALCLEEQVSALVAHRVICVNHPQRAALLARGLPEAKTFVSMNVPDPRIFQRTPGLRVAGAAGEHFDLVYHGTMAERLGVDLVIRAVARLQDRIPGVRLQLWGQGDDLDRFQRLARELGIEARVCFEPRGVRLHDLPARLQQMHLGVIGNRRSVAGDLMLPVKLMEYAALGVPAVAPRLRTIQHYFTDDMVAFYEPEDVGSLADAIDALYRDPQRRCRQAERAAGFLDEHGWQRQGAELVTFYHGLMDK